jgi:2-oxo-4-hydroxy-4-carboxy--5-ureidoimidazoline (OHCU) decarboxylase
LRLPRKAALSVIERMVTRIANSKKEFIKALPQFSQIKNTKLKDMIAQFRQVEKKRGAFLF